MSDFVASKRSGSASSHGAEQATVRLGHGRSTGVIVRRIRVRRLPGGLRIWLLALLTLLSALVIVHPGLVGSVCVIATLRVGIVVRARLAALLTVLEASVLGRAVAVLTSRRAKALVLIVLLAVLLTVLLTVALLLLAVLLVVALLGRVALVVALLGWVAALLLVPAVAAATAAVGIVGAGHYVVCAKIG